ncbi:MAG: tungstate transporter substrate-binding protein [Symbiobacteriaceae bacterium]|jgi:tungstate transport system substrate-binding protein|nr:tungstate transporter substrate-binding protein [Symbiobacteriaceae bacterium]
MGYKVLLELGGAISGDRLFALLRGVDRLGSINQAAAELKMSYRHAWGLLKAAEERVGAPLLQKRVGGAAGGGSELTARARGLLSGYEQFRARVAADAEAVFHGEDEAPGGTPLLLASTIGPVESGIVSALEEAFYQETGILVRHVAAGSGQALALAREGRAEVVLAHAPALEAEFLAAGFGTGRHVLMSNEFLLLGPAADSAGAGTAPTAGEAFRRCAAAGAPFVTRGDRSGTHVKELEVWAAAGVVPGGPWYRTCARGSMGSLATLRDAEATGAYVLVDRAAYLGARSAAGGLGLVVLSAGDPMLRNEFAVISVSPVRFPRLQHEAAQRFVTWATVGGGQEVIRRFGCEQYGEPLFFPLMT